MKIYCLGFTGKHLSDMVLDVLFDTAVRMAKSGDTSKKVVHDDVRGMVKSRYQHVVFGAVAGYVFDADIHTATGRTKARYVVRTHDLEGVEKARWHRLERKKKKSGWEPSNN